MVKNNSLIFKNILKAIIIVLYIIAMIKMPYSYYDFLKWVSVFVFFPYSIFYINKNLTFSLLILLLVVVFQPFHYFYFDRLVWMIFDSLAISSLLLTFAITSDEDLTIKETLKAYLYCTLFVLSCIAVPCYVISDKNKPREYTEEEIEEFESDYEWSGRGR